MKPKKMVDLVRLAEDVRKVSKRFRALARGLDVLPANLFALPLTDSNFSGEFYTPGDIILVGVGRLPSHGLAVFMGHDNLFHFVARPYEKWPKGIAPFGAVLGVIRDAPIEVPEGNIVVPAFMSVDAGDMTGRFVKPEFLSVVARRMDGRGDDGS